MPQTVEGLIGYTGNPRLAWDCYRRLVQGYAEVVQGLPRGPFDELVTQALSARRRRSWNANWTTPALRQLTRDLLDRFQRTCRRAVPAKIRTNN